MDSDWRIRYGRHIGLSEIGETGQQRVSQSAALLVGLGGLGVPVASYLAGAGVGTLYLNDFDTVDLSNLHRQVLYTTDDIGRRKTDVARERLMALNPQVNLTTLSERLNAAGLQEIAERATVVLDCSDNFATRFAVNDATLAARRPLVSGAAIRMEGQLAVFRNDLDQGPCYRCLYQEGGDDLENCSGGGILGPVVGAVGALMAVEALKLITGVGDCDGNRFSVYDGWRGEWRNLGLVADPECPSCARFRSR
ncbi:MAG: HesA/MoeB/ThiF family protein [Gammaproteobacteria bacterium]